MIELGGAELPLARSTVMIELGGAELPLARSTVLIELGGAELPLARSTVLIELGGAELPLARSTVLDRGSTRGVGVDPERLTSVEKGVGRRPFPAFLQGSKLGRGRAAADQAGWFPPRS